jgi:hypothetical protein
MKNQNEALDEMIKKALSKEEATYYENLNEQSLPEMVSGLYAGKLKWLNMLFVVVTLVFAAIMFYSIYQFVNTDDLKEMIRWGAAMFGSGMFTAMIKLWSWNQLDKNAILRELKRIELLLASR